jgi:hypothetical protein
MQRHCGHTLDNTVWIGGLMRAELIDQSMMPTTRRARTVPSSASAAALPLLRMQRSAGNRAVAEYLRVQRCGSTPPDECPCHEQDRESAGEQQDRPAVQRLPANLPEAHVRCRPPDGFSVQRSMSVQRDGQPLRDGDPRLEDPGFLICTAFCYLGIPPSFFKDMLQAMLESLSTEMRAAGTEGFDERFAGVRDELASYSKVRLLAKVFRFLMHGELGPGGIIRVTARSQAVRDRIVARLVTFGASHAGLVAAEAVVRKVVMIIDAVIVAGCATYCGALQIGQRVVELTEAVSQGFAAATAALSGVGRGVATAISSFVASIYGQLDTANWQLSEALPTSSRADLSVLGGVLWAQVRPGNPWSGRRPEQTELDGFLANAARPLSGYRVPRELMESIATAAGRAIAANGGSAQITADQLLAMSPAGLMAFLRDNGLLIFKQDPVAYTNSLVSAPAPAAP